MLATRTADTMVGKRTTIVKTTRGTPQGGVTSPLMWSLVVDQLLHRLTELGIDCIGYADDIVIVARDKYEGILCDIVEEGLRVTEQWCKSVGLGINLTKTAIVPFTRKRKLPNMRRIHLNGVIIEQKSEVKYLGVTLNSKLLWNKHVETTVSKATKALMVCRNLAARTWGCNPNILQLMYLMIVRHIITYGAIAWHSKVQQSNTRKTLNVIQRLACTCITGAMRTSPTAALELITD